MPDWTDLKRRADERHERLRKLMPPDTPVLAPAEAVLKALCEETGFQEHPLAPTDSLLAGALAVLERDFNVIYYASGPGISPERQRFSRAHEFAHLEIHPDLSTDSFAEEGDQLLLFQLPCDGASEVQTLQSYSPRMRQELEANLYAAELLLPAPRLRQAFLQENWDFQRICAETGLSEECVGAQLASALLLPPLPAPKPPVSPSPPKDESQHRAAVSTEKRLLVEAGPGMGKTRTLIARLAYLLQNKTPPEKILALTFSNRAAEEMRSRLREAVGPVADRVWIGTFHAFGYELICLEANLLGLPPVPKLLEPLEAALLLYNELDTFDLQELLDLAQPDLVLPDIVNCIARAKDELCGPQCYRELAEKELVNALNPTEQKRARAALVVAEIYRRYQELLQEKGALDFGDLLMRPVELLRKSQSARNRWQAKYQHILVDECQDMNRAAVSLLRWLSERCESLWLVGDTRQAIYSFRGSAAINLQQLEQLFPDLKRVALQYNYRSHPRILTLLKQLADHSSNAQTSSEAERPPEWQAVRQGHSEAAVVYGRPQTEEEETAWIAQTARLLQKRGVPFEEQAVLCRKNQQAAAIAHALLKRGVPVQLVADPLSQPAVRRLMALLALSSGGSGLALLSLGTLPDYAVPEADITKLLKAAKAHNASFPGAFALAQQLPNLSEQGRNGLQRLQDDLIACAQGGADIWRFCVRYLFQRSRWIRELLQSQTDLEALLQRSAIYQFLQMTLGWPGRTEQEVSQFVTYARLLIRTGTNRRLRLPPELCHTNALQVMTVHQAKGLEFTAVYVPGIVKGNYPARGRAALVSPPRALLQADHAANEDDLAEERRLFFVALSRAKDYLFLSAPYYRGRRELQESPFLYEIPELTPLRRAPEAWPGVFSSLSASNETAVPAPRSKEYRLVGRPLSEEAFTASALECYFRYCPKQYYYRYVLGVEEPQRAPYLCFREALDATFRWFLQSQRAGQPPTCDHMKSHFLEQCRNHRLSTDNVHGRLLQNCALQVLLPNAHTLLSARPQLQPGWSLSVALGGGSVRTAFPLVEVADAQVTILCWQPRPLKDKEKNRPLYSLLYEGATQTWPEHSIVVELVSLYDGNSQEVRGQTKHARARIEKFTEALQGIRQGDFPAKGNAWECCRCPYLWACDRHFDLGEEDSEEE
ncbi:ATP-dependent helicase [Chthonomonas calidirosea]|uniref:ATP-dependent helicase n=1 Tax=Chthonomonas calidirosea TaxID=454171 RepID=UPI0006ECCD9D|nr:ATP-dependent helicase [Chthonomonas calidirosea]CEK17053.1 DNA/RNA helicase, superfamily I [Chthonomonas calidirosea]